MMINAHIGVAYRVDALEKPLAEVDTAKHTHAMLRIVINLQHMERILYVIVVTSSIYMIWESHLLPVISMDAQERNLRAVFTAVRIRVIMVVAHQRFLVVDGIVHHIPVAKDEVVAIQKYLVRMIYVVPAKMVLRKKQPAQQLAKRQLVQLRVRLPLVHLLPVNLLQARSTQVVPQKRQQPIHILRKRIRSLRKR